MTDHAVVIADADGTITWWSPGAEVLFGHSAAAALGARLDLIVPDALRARHWAGFRRAMEAPQVKDLAADHTGSVRGRAGERVRRPLAGAERRAWCSTWRDGNLAADGTTGIKPFG